MHRGFEADPPVWIWQSEGSGTAVETDLLDAARRNWPRAVSYARRYQQDSSVAADILEKVLLATSRVTRARQKSGNPIRNLESYLYVAFVRRLNRHVARQPKIEFVGSLQDLDALSSVQNHGSPPTVEDELLVRVAEIHDRAPAGHVLSANERLLLERSRPFPWHHREQRAGPLQQGTRESPRTNNETERFGKAA